MKGWVAHTLPGKDWFRDLGFRDLVGFRVLGLRVEGLGFRDLGFRVTKMRFRVNIRLDSKFYPSPRSNGRCAGALKLTEKHPM